MKKLRRKLNKMLKKAISKKSPYFKVFFKKIGGISENIKKSINPGELSPAQARILILGFLVIFAGYVALLEESYNKSLISNEDQFEQAIPQDIRASNLKRDLNALVKGSPIEAMVPYIAQKDRKTAAYLIGIAKKESNWGKRKPVLAGADCYNYWGFRLKQERMGSGGHTCFDSPKEAVEVVSGRIEEIMSRNEVNSAKNMMVWKCGSNCDITGGQASADKWAKDVDMYAKKVLN